MVKIVVKVQKPKTREEIEEYTRAYYRGESPADGYYIVESNNRSRAQTLPGSSKSTKHIENQESRFESKFSTFSSERIWGPFAVTPIEELIRIGEVRREGNELVFYRREKGNPPYVRAVGEYKQREVPLQLCSLEEARRICEVIDLPIDQVDRLVTVLRGTAFYAANLNNTDDWGEQWVELIPEPLNPYDQHAVSIEYQSNRIGYLKSDYAYQIHWIIRCLNEDGFRCLTPAFIQDITTVWIVLPTVDSFQKQFEFAHHREKVKSFWMELTDAEFAEETTRYCAHPSIELMPKLLSKVSEAPYLFPLNKQDPSFSPLWNSTFYECMTIKRQEKERKRLARMKELAKEMVILYEAGATYASLSRQFGMTTYMVKKHLELGGAVLRGNQSQSS